MKHWMYIPKAEIVFYKKRNKAYIIYFLYAIFFCKISQSLGEPVFREAVVPSASNQLSRKQRDE